MPETMPDDADIDLDLGPATPATSADLVPVEEATGRAPERSLELLAESSRNISRMRDTRFLTKNELAEKRIISQDMQNTKVANVFREMRTRLLQSGPPFNFTTMVTSIVSGGGASHVALNLAAAFAFDESKTAMIIDCNIQEPALNEILDINPAVGLTNYLEDPSIEVDDIIFATGIPRLRIIPAGKRKEHATEFFSSIRMRKLIQSLQKRYPDRYLILDAPPIGESVDAKLLADACDRVVLVAPYGKVTEQEIATASHAIGRDKLAGVVMNDEPTIQWPW
ncbi:MAG TPA: polysaccharide biosynthesis protein [Gammaproteobacteria bacterium]|nr:polysaccharide biosynthesis protein [Gammaproteobacteria bacterium]